MRIKFFIGFFLVLILVFSSCSSSQDFKDDNGTNGMDVGLVNEVSNISNLNVSEDLSDFDEKIVIVAFGDSLTEGLGVERDEAYPKQLESELLSLGYNVEVFNSGLSGETSSGALSRINWVLQLNPDVVILTIGANDAIRGLDLNLTRSNINEILDILEENQVKVVFSGMEIYDNMGEKYKNEFKSLYFEIAELRNLSFIPFFLEGVAGNNSLNNQDRIHPNKEGYEIIVKDNILPVLVPVLDKLE